MFNHDSDTLAQSKLPKFFQQPVAEPFKEGLRAAQVSKASFGGKSALGSSTSKLGGEASARTARLDETEEEFSLCGVSPFRRAPVQSQVDCSFLGSFNMLA